MKRADYLPCVLKIYFFDTQDVIKTSAFGGEMDSWEESPDNE